MSYLRFDVSDYYYSETYNRNENEENKYVNLRDIHYPESFSEIVDRSLINIYRVFSNYSDKFTTNEINGRMVFADNNIEDNRIGFLIY